MYGAEIKTPKYKIPRKSISCLSNRIQYNLLADLKHVMQLICLSIKHEDNSSSIIPTTLACLAFL